MTIAKRKISVSLDEDLVAELENAEESLSSQVNAVLREDLVQRRRQRLLAEYLDQLDAEEGPVDEALIDKYARLLA
jgi:metal-responsive CopG/Arc/MetJ family transcriptional regulator